ncbi:MULTISPECIES: hypothetical protein [unclassified Cupriavidus]|uniref:hypothetical protein n=1 Tax=Cupriavidus sp. H19C3 TaxID=3241603 RepID=UPI003BF80BC0
MTDPRSILLVGKPAYYWSYLAPVAREFRRRFEEPVTAVALKGAFGDDPSFVRPGTLRPYRRARVAIAFDVWSMIAARACARTVVYVHHSLVGKGLVFRGHEPFRPFAFANMLCLPLPERELDMPVRTRAKVRITGHPPFDWLVAETPLQHWLEALHAWGDNGRRLRVAVLCTHGEFGSVHLLDDIARMQPADLDLGVKLHGYLGKRTLPPGVRDLGDCPTALIVQHSDLVITDHSTAAVEAHALGVPCICYRSAALTQLQQRYPTLSEFGYLDDAHSYETVAGLTALLR